MDKDDYDYYKCMISFLGTENFRREVGDEKFNAYVECRRQLHNAMTRDYINKHKNEVIHCETCNKDIKRFNMTDHKKTKAHQKALDLNHQHGGSS